MRPFVECAVSAEMRVGATEVAESRNRADFMHAFGVGAIASPHLGAVFLAMGRRRAECTLIRFAWRECKFLSAARLRMPELLAFLAALSRRTPDRCVRCLTESAGGLATLVRAVASR